jgi:hypothetical protein
VRPRNRNQRGVHVRIKRRVCGLNWLITHRYRCYLFNLWPPAFNP